MTTITLAGLTIHQDAEGRYSLNDLFRASGGANHHRPSLWLRSKQTQNLVQAHQARIRARSGVNPQMGLEAGIPASTGRSPEHEFVLREDEERARIRARSVAPVVIEAAKNPSTYVVKELVYAYAMWISPEFHLQVIDAYDALVTGRIAEVHASLTQTEKYWFARRPHWPEIRQRVLAGERYRQVAAAMVRSVRSVVWAVKRMVEVGLMDPARLVAAQHGPAQLAARRLCAGWGVAPQQLALDLGR